MRPLHLVRRIHAPMVCVVIACLVSVGCATKRETLTLGEPAEAYRADDGSVLFGYYVQPTIQPDWAGWHWLIIEPGTAERLQGGTNDSSDARVRTVVVDYQGWGANAKLVPPLLEPGLPEATPPVVGDGGLRALRFSWDAEARGVRLLDDRFAELALVRVSPGAELLKVRVYDRDLMWDVVAVVAVGALIAGLIIAGGSGSIDFN